MDAQIPTDIYWDVLGYIMDNSSKIRLRDIYEHFKDKFSEDFTRKDMHLLLDFWLSNKSMRINGENNIIWLGSKKGE